MVHATMDCGKQERVDEFIPLWYSSCWHGPGQHCLFQHMLSTCEQFHHLNLPTKVTAEKREGVLGRVLASTSSVCVARWIPGARCVVYFIVF